MENNGAARRFWRAGELASVAGVSTDTLRHYERKKVLPPPLRAINGYRQYAPESLERVQLIRRALAFGFTLDELALILEERDRGGSPCREVRRLAAEKLAMVEEQLKSLADLRDDLRNTLADWNERLARAGQTSSRLLDNLPEPRTSRSALKLAPNSKRKKEGYK